MPKLLGLRLSAAVTLLATALAGCDARDVVPPRADLTDQVKAVVDRTKVTRAVYSNYGHTMVVLDDGSTKLDWGAEFNDGVHHHRVEVSMARIVADCQDMTGTMLSLTRNEKRSGSSAARSACGIDTSADITASKYLGVVNTPWGRADRIRLTVGDVARVYDVNQDGVLVGETWYKGGKVVLQQTVLAVLPSVSSHDMFDDASLDKSFTPDQYKVLPAAPTPGG
jgi:hypothetical protein